MIFPHLLNLPVHFSPQLAKRCGRWWRWRIQYVPWRDGGMTWGWIISQVVVSFQRFQPSKGSRPVISSIFIWHHSWRGWKKNRVILPERCRSTAHTSMFSGSSPKLGQASTYPGVWWSTWHLGSHWLDQGRLMVVVVVVAAAAAAVMVMVMVI